LAQYYHDYVCNQEKRIGNAIVEGQFVVDLLKTPPQSYPISEVLLEKPFIGKR